MLIAALSFKCIRRNGYMLGSKYLPILFSSFYAHLNQRKVLSFFFVIPIISFKGRNPGMGYKPSETVRVAIVGCGAVTEKKHLPALATSQRVRVTALVDLDEERLRRLGKAYGIQHLYRDVADLAEYADIGLVAVPHHLHARVAVDVMKAGLHAFVEKPLATTTANVEVMMEASAKFERRVGVGLVRRQYSSFKFVKSVLAHGWLGEVHSFDFREGAIYNWPVATDTTFRKATAGGVLFDMGAHTLDMLLSWLGDFECVSYFEDSRGGVEANCLLDLTLTSGVRGVVELSRTRNLRNSCIIRGERGEIEVGVGPQGPVTLRTDTLELTATPKVFGKDEPSPLEQTRIQMEDFADAIQRGTDCSLFAEHTLESIRLYDRCKEHVQVLELPWEDFRGAFNFWQLDGRTVLVLGGTGFIGGRLVEVLSLRSQARIRVLARSFARLSGVSRFGVEVIPGDITDREALGKAMAGCDVVFNCTYGRGSRKESRRINVEAVKMLVREAARARVGCVIHFSTVSAYGLPPDGDLTEDNPRSAPRSDVYGFTKWEGEQVGFTTAKKLGVDFRVLEPTVVYGPGAPSWTLNPLRMLKTGRVVLVNGGDGLCNAVYVDDVVLAMLCTSVAKDGAGERFLVSGPAPVRWHEFYGAYEAMLGFTSTVSVPLEELLRLCRQARRRAGTVAQFWDLIRDEAVLHRVLALPLVQSLKRIASRKLVDAAKEVLVGGQAPLPQRNPEKPMHLWSEFDAIHQARKTRVSISKAQRLLGYEPAFDLPGGMARTQQWAEWANLLG